MSQKLKGFTIHEGYTDLGTLSVNINHVETPVLSQNPRTDNVPEASRFSLFRLLDTEGNPLPDGLRVEFKMDTAGNEEVFTSYTSKEGFVGFTAPVLPIVRRNEDGSMLIKAKLSPAYDNRQEECYLEVVDFYTDEAYYTLSLDLGFTSVSNSGPGIYTDYQPDSLDTFYNLGIGGGSISDAISAMAISPDGRTFAYNTATSAWVSMVTLRFAQFENPDGLVPFREGLYQASGASGAGVTGELGTGTFDKFSLSIENSVPYYYDANIKVYEEGNPTPLYESKHDNIMPGDRNYIPITVDYTPTGKGDDSPTVTEVETIGDLTFSTSFKEFLEDKELTTLKSLGSAGPIKYLIDLPDLNEDDEKMQSYVDLYALTDNVDHIQRLVSVGYTTLYDIASTPRSKFVADVTEEEEPTVNVFRAAQIHNAGIQQARLLSNMMADVVTDYALHDSAYSQDRDSLDGNNGFGSEVLGEYLNSCSCDDCKSGVSPFAYLTDLAKYAAQHINKTGSGAYHPTNYASFLVLLRNTFLQPYDSLPVTCDTLHDEYCRVRLVTEVLEKLVIANSGTISSDNLARLEIDRKEYLQVTYNTLLTQAGTSFNEVRGVFIASDLDDKKDRAQTLSDKLGIPLYVPGSSTDFTADRLWLSLSGSGMHELTAENLEEVFCFRDTMRLTTEVTPESLMEIWQAAYLRDTWRNADYPLSVYTREGVEGTGGSFVYQSHWMPIVDPDIMGMADMAFLPNAIVKNLWTNRKKNVDDFVKYFTTNTAILSQTAVDTNSRIVRVDNENIAQHTIDDNMVRFIRSGTTDLISYEILKRMPQGTDTDFYLKLDGQTPMYQPDGLEPKLRYHRKIKVTNAPTSSNNITLILDENITHRFTDTGAYAKLMSTASEHVYETSQPGGSSWYMEPTYSPSFQNQVTVYLEDAPDLLDTDFLNGDLYFVYEVTVALAFVDTPDPVKLVNKLFAETQAYTFLDPSPFGTSFTYTAWLLPSWGGSFLASTNYGKLKELQEFIESAETDNETYLDIVRDNLRMDLPSFSRMMTLLGVVETYLASMYTAPQPTIDELSELASLFFLSAKKKLASEWVKEEIEHDPGAGIINIHLLSTLFSKSMEEPVAGLWDANLQTIPDVVGDIDPFVHVPIIDPELLNRNSIREGIGQEGYFTFFDTRQTTLDLKRKAYLEWVTVNPYNSDGFVKIFNNLKYDTISTDPLPELTVLLTNWRSSDPFVKQAAAQTIRTDFGMDGDTFERTLKIKMAYEDANPVVHPSLLELERTVRELVTAYKVKWLYPGSLGWIALEVGEVDETPIQYYDVLKMRMAPGRGDYGLRAEWQRTLQNWNSAPVVEPDIVGAENIKTFLDANTVHDEWVNFWEALYAPVTGLYTQIKEEWLNTDLYPDSEVWDSYRELICRSFFGTGMDDTHISYFIELQEREDRGEDIRPRLAYYGVSITQYRSLKRVYELMESTVSAGFPLLESEYEEVSNVFFSLIKQKELYGVKKLDQFQADIILCGDEFKIYKPDTINFPLTDLPVYNENRFPQKARKEWLDLLENRNDREQFSQDGWETVLAETEDRVLRVLRDALIRALAKECEPFDVTAERLAKTLFIETKDNCCSKHTRVSQAIETLQGFVYSLKSGIYDNYLSGFSISANNFEQEWEWLGSYATWRAAIFTYLYPENLLYPTLKRIQSPIFQKVAQTLQDSSRFTPLQACRLAKEYQGYFEDVNNLDLKFTVSANSKMLDTGGGDCCQEIYKEQYMDYFFATSKISGKHYWSSKANVDTSGQSHGFWQELPIGTNCDLVGCFPLPLERNPDTSVPYENALWLFYSYFEEGELKLAYIQKKLERPGSWSDQFQTADLPKEYGESNFGRAKSILACQSSLGWDWPSFIVNYVGYTGIATGRAQTQSQEEYTYPELYVHIRYFDDNDAWDVCKYFTDKSGDKPITAIRHSAGNDNTENLYIVTVVFPKKIVSLKFGYGYWLVSASYYGAGRVLGAFQSRDDVSSSSSTIQILREIPIGNTTGFSISTFNFFTTTFQNVPPLQNTPAQIVPGRYLLGLCPIFSQVRPATFGFNVKGGICMSGLPNYGPVGNYLQSQAFIGYLNLNPYHSVSAQVQSADCAQPLRSENVKNHMTENWASFSGSTLLYGTRLSPTIAEYLREAYYFVPMLLALDQQQRGQYEAALDWYRTVYDYTISGNNGNRKVYYGLLAEESVQNVYTRPSDWLLDPLNPHLIAKNRANAYTKYTVMNIVQCILAFADREYTLDTVETVPRARMLYATALELLGIKELKLAPGVCDELVLCFPNSISQQDATWQALFNVLQQQLQSLGNAADIAEAKEEIIEIFENGELDTWEQFTQAFAAIETVRAAHVHEAENFSAVVAGAPQRFNDMFRFLGALPSLQASLAQLPLESNGQFSWRIGNILEVDAEELETESSLQRMAWLATDRELTEPYQFNFADSEGVQNLPGAKGYNPLEPRGEAFMANLVYANATMVLDTPLIQPYIPDYIPLIDLKYCLPANPVYSSLRLKANLELYKIQNCRNIAGMVRELDVYAAPTDSTSGIPVIGAGGTLVLPGLNKYKPSQYRFRVLVERAKQMVSMAQQMESLFLSAMEKRDTEYYSELRARQDIQTARATVKLQDLRVNQANDERDMADLQLQKASFMQDTYNGWIDDGYNGYEITSLAMLQASVVMQAVATAHYFTGAVLKAGMMDFGGTEGLSGQAFGTLAQTLSTQASIFSQIASYERRRQEWEYQSALAGYDISIANQQIKIAEDNIRITSQERQIAQLNTDNAQDTLEFLKTKFTNAELYNWMSNVLERTYSYLLNLATSVARTAEGQLYFERQEQAGPFILDDYWETPGDNYAVSVSGTTAPDRRGLTGSARLLMDLTRLDQYAFETDKRKLQLTKTLSLAQNFPVEFQRFRETGVLNFELTNTLFDYDFPGHYLRLIHTVKSTVVGLVPVYGGIKATLTAEPTSYTVIGGTTFQRVPIKRLEVDSVALTSANAANGLFEMQPTQGEMLNPFEGMGVESRWEFKMPKFSNRMDYDQVADVLITVEYTALDSFQYRYQVLQDLDNTPFFDRAFSFKNNFPDQWFELSNAQDGTDTFGVTFTTKKEDFPQGFSEIRFGGRMLLYFVRDDSFTEDVEIHNFRYLIGGQTAQPLGGTTVESIYQPRALSNQLTGSPFRTWVLEFENNITNRELFSTGQIKDILFVMTCVGDLPAYPL